MDIIVDIPMVQMMHNLTIQSKQPPFKSLSVYFLIGSLKTIYMILVSIMTNFKKNIEFLFTLLRIKF